MPLNSFIVELDAQVAELARAGTTKGGESVVTAVRRPAGDRGPRLLLEGEGERQFIRMNSNSYLGLSLRPELAAAGERAVHDFGVGPGAVRFISGTSHPHLLLERALAAFHGRGACQITSAAYNAVMGVIASLTTPETVLISDELNHNCIVNAMKLARPKEKKVYKHLDVRELESQLEAAAGQAKDALVI